MRRAFLIAVSLLLLIAAACSDDGGDDERAQTVEPTTTTAELAVTTTTAGSVVDPSAISEEQLQATLLTLEDMPAGYSPLPAEDGDEPGTYCDGRDPGTEVPELIEVEAQFVQDPTTGPLIGSAAATYSSDEEASRYLAATLDAAQQCPGPYPSPGADDGSTTTLAPLSFDSYGDETLALRATFDGSLIPFTADLVFVRVGPVIFQTAQATSIGGGDVDQLQSLLETQLERTTALAGS